MTATRSFIIAAVLAALAIAAALAFIMYRPAPSPDDAQEPPAATAQGEDSADDTSASQAAMVAPPVFDIVRVAPVGSAVTAGRGEPGATIQLLADGDPLAFTSESGEQTDIQTINERG